MYFSSLSDASTQSTMLASYFFTSTWLIDSVSVISWSPQSSISLSFVHFFCIPFLSIFRIVQSILQGGCPGVYSFDEISAIELVFEKFFVLLRGVEWYPKYRKRLHGRLPFCLRADRQRERERGSRNFVLQHDLWMMMMMKYTYRHTHMPIYIYI